MLSGHGLFRAFICRFLACLSFIIIHSRARERKNINAVNARIPSTKNTSRKLRSQRSNEILHSHDLCVICANLYYNPHNPVYIRVSSITGKTSRLATSLYKYLIRYFGRPAARTKRERKRERKTPDARVSLDRACRYAYHQQSMIRNYSKGVCNNRNAKPGSVSTQGASLTVRLFQRGCVSRVR